MVARARRSPTITPMPAADLSRLHAVIPIRSAGGGKLRLGERLDPEEREGLIIGMLVHELRVLDEWGGCEAIHVVSRDRLLADRVADMGGWLVVEAAEGLNEGLRSGVRAAIARGATAVLILPADVPLLDGGTLDRLRDAADAALAAGSGAPVAVVAPADARGGTNALLLSPPDLIEPQFGPDSLERHLRAAATADASVQVIIEPALGFDLDTPEDLARLEPGRLHELVALGTR
jgi:2-phospho-L-lactate guanylyltransferase